MMMKGPAHASFQSSPVPLGRGESDSISVTMREFHRRPPRKSASQRWSLRATAAVILLHSLLAALLPWSARGFAPSSIPFRIEGRRGAFSLPSPPPAASRTHLLRMALVADEKEELHKRRQDDNRNSNNDDNNDNAWIKTAGGYLPNLNQFRPPSASAATPRENSAASAAEVSPPSALIAQVTTIQDYKRVVADEADRIVVVRFYAPWCRACRAVAAPFRKLAQDLRGGGVKFVEVPLTPDNAYLHQGLGVASLPYGHIYHPQAGLVEEQSLNKKHFAAFKDKLQTYVDGMCDVVYPDQSD